MQMMGANDTIQIAVGHRNRRPLSDFYDSDDYALRDFVKRVRQHVFSRITNMELTPELMPYLDIVGDCIYEHAKFRVNYQTYDLRKDVDSINPSNHADIMTLSSSAKEDGEHPYNYGRVCGVYHAVRKKGTGDNRLEVLLCHMFVDRDIFMRLRGGGVGHQHFWEYCSSLVQESGLEDQQGRLPVYDDNGEIMEPGASRAEDGGDDEDEEEPGSSSEESSDDSESDKDSILTHDPDSDDSDIEYIGHASI
ncbi:hypothetical protein MPER_13134 [Moniliophthora perniciosa FA553]|nr:hypothetical protein MPER_13134 [Moniliophthora perniciosa FA553]